MTIKSDSSRSESSSTRGVNGGSGGDGGEDGEVKIIPIDWQAPKIGPGETDLGYFISQSVR